MPRVQSPSSINTYKQCPRRYYYSYIEKLPKETNIHCLRGNIVHEVLEKFFEINPEKIDENNYMTQLSFHLKNLFHSAWDREREELRKLNLNNDELQFYYQDSLIMLANWINAITSRIDREMQSSTFTEAFNKIKPDIIEEEFVSDFYKIRGFIDLIHMKDGKVKILDYKTSKYPELKPEYKLQLGIYALLFEEKYGQRPDEAGIWFLKHDEITIPVTEDLIKDTKFEIEQIHLATETDDEKDYPRNPGPLCKYATGQCEFYDICYGLKENNSQNL